MYQELKPSEELKCIIDSFWTFSGNKESESFKVLPDNCADLIFDFKQKTSFLSGVMTKYQLRELTNESDLIGIRFKAEDFGLLSEIPLDEIKNLRVDLSQVLSKVGLDRLTRLYDLENKPAQLNFLEDFIETTFKLNYRRRDKTVLSVAQAIRSSKGKLSIAELGRNYHMSLRQLERRFKNRTGLTVKEFSNVVRFNKARKVIAICGETSLMEIAFDMGFYDHSHMTHEFKRISGQSPSFFR